MACLVRTRERRGSERRVELLGVGDRRNWTVRSLGVGRSDQPSTDMLEDGCVKP